MLIAIANGEKSLTAVETTLKYNLGTPQNVSKNKKILQNADLIELTKDGFEFLDPVFKRWFTMEYVR